jgi:hypothetical protein
MMSVPLLKKIISQNLDAVRRILEDSENLRLVSAPHLRKLSRRAKQRNAEVKRINQNAKKEAHQCQQ